ncbi:hypothetical protein [Hymenobacter glaciei]|uniref:hypothetical protein n=1 Tax=Hymenobacter glaciei TaxID=877209 RepID=UPI0031F042A8
MPPFSVQLRVASYVFPERHCTCRTSQATDSRGRAVTKMQHHAVDPLLYVPNHDLLLA